MVSQHSTLTSSEEAKYTVSQGVCQEEISAKCQLFDMLPNPKQLSLGIEYVFVNGKMVVEKGKHTGAFLENH